MSIKRKTSTNTLLQDGDPPPFILSKGSSPIIFTSPHNGIAVPCALHQTLGMDEDWFYKAHEAQDLHIGAVLKELKNQRPSSSTLEAVYSRLMIDLNRRPDDSIPPASSEYPELLIAQNDMKNCNVYQRVKRLKEIYEPYHNAKTQLIEDIRSQNENRVLVFDLHSFTPEWRGERRDVEIGTIRCQKSPLSRAFENYLREGQDDFNFISGEPYRVADRDVNVARILCQNNKLPYFGLEIRNDLIANAEGVQRVVKMINDGIEHIMQHADVENIMKPQLLTDDGKHTPCDKTENIPFDTWSI